jgi:DNA invertase Pin-like site-specific DNA recombinase
MCKIYGYCRISRRTQSIDRQERNILATYPNAIIRKEAYTGTKMNRPEWKKLFAIVKEGDTIVFDSVSRMSRNAEDGTKIYFELLERGVELVFLKEHYIDTSVYKCSIQDKIELTGSDEDEIFKGINNYFRKLAIRQIRIAFEQAQKEVDDLHQRTAEGIETARLNGKKIGQTKGAKLTTKKSIAAKAIIMKHSKDFDGTLTDEEVIKLADISRNSFYKYKRELKEL